MPDIAELDKLLNQIKGSPLVSGIIQELSHRLPQNLSYHNVNHTVDVLRETLLFSMIDGLSGAEVELLAIAAAYHDAGYLKSPHDNEVIGAEMARKAMQQMGGFSEDDIRIVETMILDTRLIVTSSGLKQFATTELSKYLLDADLSNFGRDDFFERGERQRNEVGMDPQPFLERSFELLKTHRWQTEAAKHLRDAQKERNVQRLKELIELRKEAAQRGQVSDLERERTEFLASLPLLLNSSLDSREIIERALENLKFRLDAEAATVFLLNSGGDELTFWALKGGSESKLEGKRMPAGKGIVGWVIEKQEAVLVPDVQKDPRFFSEIDREVKFITRNLICTPLLVRGRKKIGAIQVLNRKGAGTFTPADLIFVERMCHQIALAIENARLYEELSVRNRQLEILDKRKNEMISVIAHEFRTPLNVILTSADVIASGMVANAKSLQTMNETLANGVSRMTNLINQISELSTLNVEKLKIKRRLFLVDELVQLAISAYKEPVAQRNQTLIVDVDPNASKLNADFGLLHTVLRNLISNAIRFTPDKGTIIVSVKRTAGMAEFSITDNGIGIDSSQQQVIFEKFYEVTESIHHHSGEFEFKSSGLGLGLATVKAILEAHGVEIQLKSALGKGSQFLFCLPLA